MHVFLVSLPVQFPSIHDYVKNPLLENIHFWGSKKPVHSLPQMNELHRLLLASLLHAGEQPARVFADAAVLLFGGTLLLS